MAHCDCLFICTLEILLHIYLSVKGPGEFFHAQHIRQETLKAQLLYEDVTNTASRVCCGEFLPTMLLQWLMQTNNNNNNKSHLCTCHNKKCKLSYRLYSIEALSQYLTDHRYWPNPSIHNIQCLKPTKQAV